MGKETKSEKDMTDKPDLPMKPITDEKLAELDDWYSKCSSNSLKFCDADYLAIRARLALSESERDAARAENVALWRVADAAKDVIRFTEPEWRNDVDRGDADTKLAETVATLPPRDVKGEGT